MRDELLLIKNPLQYLDGEVNAVRKDFESAAARIALAFPDLYELGMSHQGLKILYEIVNAREEYLAERVFAPWIDREEQLRREGTPLAALESGRPLSHFDVARLHAALRADRHEHPDHARPGAPAAARARPRRAPPARHRRRAGGLQPRAAGRLLRLLPARRRRGGDPRDHGGHARRPRRQADPRGAARPPGADRGHLRAALLPRRVRRRRAFRRDRAAARRRAPAHQEADARRPRRRPLPGAPAGALRRDHPRPDHHRDRARLHPALPLLPGRHHLSPLPRAQHAPGPGDGGRGARRDRLRRALARRALLRRPPAHRDADHRADAPLRKAPRLDLAALAAARDDHRRHPARDRQGQAHRVHHRPRGRHAAHARRDQQGRSPRR